MTNEPTIRDVMATVTETLEVLNAFSSHVDSRFDRLEKRVGNLENDVSVLTTDMSSVKIRLDSMQSRIDSVQTSMVTKDYMEGRLAAMSR